MRKAVKFRKIFNRPVYIDRESIKNVWGKTVQTTAGIVKVKGTADEIMKIINNYDNGPKKPGTKRNCGQCDCFRHAANPDNGKCLEMAASKSILISKNMKACNGFRQKI